MNKYNPKTIGKKKAGHWLLIFFNWV